MKKLFLLVLLAIIFGGAPGRADTSDADSCKDCKACAQFCSGKAAQLEKKAGKSVDPKLVALMKDCASICNVNEGFRQRKSTFRGQVDKVCADVCARCAQACQDSKDPQLKTCADLCRKCSTSCKDGK